MDKARPASIQEYMVNTLIAEYLGARAHTCTLSVFLPEVSLSDSAVLTHDDILSLLEIRPGTRLYSAVHSSMVEEKENRKSRSSELQHFYQRHGCRFLIFSEMPCCI